MANFDNLENEHVVISNEELQALSDKIDAENLRADGVKNMSSGEAAAVLKRVGHSCPSVIAVEHHLDSTSAICSDGERYRIFIPDSSSEPLAMKCSAVAAMGIEGC